jgi:hydrogenase maturation protease
VSVDRCQARLVIGIGNSDRGDDGAGRAVVRRLRDLGVPGLEVRESDGEGTSLMAAWEGADEVTLVDACRGAGAPGSVHRIEGGDAEQLTSLSHASTHSFGVAAAVGLARALGRLPSRLVIYAIEGLHFGQGEGLSANVDHAADQVVALVVQHLSRLPPTVTPHVVERRSAAGRCSTRRHEAEGLNEHGDAVLVIAWGNPLREDDGVGWHVLEALRAARPRPGGHVFRLRHAHQLTPELAEPVSHAAGVVFVDARRDGTPGTVRCEPVAPSAGSNPLAHTLGPSGLLLLAEQRYGRAPRAVVISVTGACFAFGEGISPCVRRAIPRALRAVLRQARDWARRSKAAEVTSPGR